MLEQALTHLIVCLMISQKNTCKSDTRELAWILGRFVFLQNLFEIRLANRSN